MTVLCSAKSKMFTQFLSSKEFKVIAESHAMISTFKDAASRRRQRHGLAQQAAELGASSKNSINLNKEKKSRQFFQTTCTFAKVQMRALYIEF